MSFEQVTYRAFCSSQVVEIIKQPKENCITAIGQLIGLEPCTTVCRWYPAAEGFGMDPQRPGIEGFYLLRELPELKSQEEMPLAAFPDGSRESIGLTLKEIYRKNW